MRRALILTGLVAAGLAAAAPMDKAQAQAKSLTLCWAAWDPANALVELGKDFTAKTGIEMKYEFVPWTSYADRFLNELNTHSKLCDLIIGDSQWIGGAAENGHYIKLNDFFDKEGIKMEDFMPATVVGYSEWPKNTPNYWALPGMADAVGWTYRKDWFSRPEIQSEFKKKYGHDLAPPQTYDELKRIAEFFQGREIDGKKVYGAYIFTERGSEGITMGVTNVMYDYGFRIRQPEEALSDEWLREFARRREGARILQGALQVLHGTRHEQRLYVGRPGRLQVGASGDADELVRLLPWPLQGPECGWRQDRLLRQSGRDAAIHATWRAGPLGRLLFRQEGRRTPIRQMVCTAGCAAKVVGSRRLFGAQGRGAGSGICQERALRGGLSEIDGDREGFLGGARLCGAAARHAEARARLRRR